MTSWLRIMGITGFIDKNDFWLCKSEEDKFKLGSRKIIIEEIENNAFGKFCWKRV